jgi:cytochrome c biogenesis protein CcmG, thiol:disulfide interchange protein DsbE
MEPLSDEQQDVVVPRRRGHTALVAAAAVATVVLLLVVVLNGSEPAKDRITESPLLGEVAPAIEATELDGDPFDLDALRGQWVVLNFFATWCAPCRQEHPELVSFHRRHVQLGDAIVVSVVYDDDRASVEEFFDENGGDWPVVAGDSGRIALDYGVAGVPESYLVDPNGFVRAKLTGGVTGLGLDQLLDRLA